jgi:hypothetical protein
VHLLLVLAALLLAAAALHSRGCKARHVLLLAVKLLLHVEVAQLRAAMLLLAPGARCRQSRGAVERCGRGRRVLVWCA